MADYSKRPTGSPAKMKLQLSSETLASDGWVSLPPSGDGVSVHVRVQRGEDGRFVATDVYLHGAKITAEMLRRAQPARIEAMLNLAADYKAEAASGKEHNPQSVYLFKADVMDHLHPDDGLTLGELRERSADAEATEVPERKPLNRPDGKDPEGFYRRVAEAYRSAAAESSRPASLLAQEADVPVDTVRTWLREARRRGFLPPGRKGRTG
jgi:hypothetical protein